MRLRIEFRKVFWNLLLVVLTGVPTTRNEMHGEVFTVFAESPVNEIVIIKNVLQ